MDPLVIILIAYAFGAITSIRPLGRRRLAAEGSRDLTNGYVLVFQALIWPLIVIPLLAIHSIPKTDQELKEEARRMEIEIQVRDQEIARMERDLERQERIDDPRLAFKRVIEKIEREGSRDDPERRLRRAREYLVRRGLNPDDYEVEMADLRAVLYLQHERQLAIDSMGFGEATGLDKPRRGRFYDRKFFNPGA